VKLPNMRMHSGPIPRVRLTTSVSALPQQQHLATAAALVGLAAEHVIPFPKIPG
jgi:hypothetical protein